jgi:hypothetical protein
MGRGVQASVIASYAERRARQARQSTPGGHALMLSLRGSEATAAIYPGEEASSVRGSSRQGYGSAR